MISIWAIADLHLSFGVPHKKMDIFGDQWVNHPQKIKAHWEDLVKPEDLVLIAGDISWAMTLEQAMPDLMWVNALPGTKVMIRGNHDYWWGSITKIRANLPPSLHLVQNDAWLWNDIAVGGARLWDTDEFNFSESKGPVSVQTQEELIEQKKIYQRELERLKLSLSQLSPQASIRIAMTHYPPVGTELRETQATNILEDAGIQICVFGHLHGIQLASPFFGEKKGVRYYLTACDFLGFKPLKII